MVDVTHDGHYGRTLMRFSAGFDIRGIVRRTSHVWADGYNGSEYSPTSRYFANKTTFVKICNIAYWHDQPTDSGINRRVVITIFYIRGIASEDGFTHKHQHTAGSTLSL